MTAQETEAPPALILPAAAKLPAWWARGSTLSAVSLVVFLGLWQFVTSAGLIEPLGEHHAPTRGSGGVNSSGNQRRACTLGE